MTHAEILQKAIEKAIRNGYVQGIQWFSQVINDYQSDYNYSGLIFNHDFAKAIWGRKQVDDAGTSLTSIALWAKQVAIEHAGKVYEVDTKIQHHYMLELGETNLTNYTEPTELVEAKKVHYQLKDLAGSVPFRTHRITEVKVVGGQEKWEYHLQKMVLHPNPIKYLGENI